MRLFPKILSITLVLSVLSVLFVPSVKAECRYDTYGRCGGSCPGGSCQYYEHACQCIPNVQPTSTPRPQPTKESASPTVTKAPTPTTGGMQCSSTTQCYNAYCAPSLTPIPNCSSVCINGHCYTTNPTSNPTITNVPCQSPNDYGPWSGCLSGQGACGGCAAWGYTCQVRYCINPPNSNQYQISCGCGQPPGGGGGGVAIPPTPHLQPQPQPPLPLPFFACAF